MQIALVFIGLPFATFLALACLPRGRIAAIGISIAMLLCAWLWVQFSAVDAGASDIGDGFIPALVTLVFSATVLAAIVQMIRSMMGAGRPGWVYPAVITVALLAAGIPLIKSLGI